MTLITFDSNDPRVIERGIRYLCEPVAEWCDSVDACELTCAKKAHRLFCNTPIAMSTDAKRYLDNGNKYVHFVYIDRRMNNGALARIIDNVRNRGNVVTVVNEEGTVGNEGTYRLIAKHASVDTIAEIVAMIINAFIYNNGRLVHPSDIIARLCGETNGSCNHVFRGMRFDIIAALRRKNHCLASRAIVDCSECEV